MTDKIQAKAVALFLYDSYADMYEAFNSFVDINKHMIEDIHLQSPYVQLGHYVSVLDMQLAMLILYHNFAVCNVFSFCIMAIIQK